MKTITIGVPTFNGAHRINYLLESIKKINDVPDGYKREFLLVDDGSPESDQMRWISQHWNLPVIFHGKNEGISKSWNDICQYGNADYICLLNDDILVVEKWLTSGIYTLENNPGIGVVGWDFMRIIEDDIEKILNDEPVPLRDKNSAEIIKSVEMPDKPILSLYAPGCSFMMSREAYEMTEGFDENYKSFYEEADYAVQLYEKGLRSITLNTPMLWHLWGRTFETNIKELKPSQRMLKSRMYFKKKWGEDIDEIKTRLMREIEPMEVKWLDRNMNKETGIIQSLHER